MKKLLLIAAAFTGVAVLAGLGGATTATASSNVTIHLTPCFFQGGTTTVPAGSTVSGNVRWAEQTRGLLQSFLESQTRTASVNGSSIANAGSLWSGPHYDASFGDFPWLSDWTAVLGTLANPGDQLVVTLQINLQHRIPVGRDPDTGKMFYDGPGDAFPPDVSCTITAV